MLALIIPGPEGVFVGVEEPLKVSLSATTALRDEETEAKRTKLNA